MNACKGAAGLTGDGYLMAAEAGAELSSMEFIGQYGIVPFKTASNKGLIYTWATFMREDGTPIEDRGEERQVLVARALAKGPVFARFDNVSPELQRYLRAGQPNILLPFDRAGNQSVRTTLSRHAALRGTVRGVGGIRLDGESGATGVPGLFAAGDAASRERLTGAISGWWRTEFSLGHRIGALGRDARPPHFPRASGSATRRATVQRSARRVCNPPQSMSSKPKYTDQPQLLPHATDTPTLAHATRRGLDIASD